MASYETFCCKSSQIVTTCEAKRVETEKKEKKLSLLFSCHMALSCTQVCVDFCVLIPWQQRRGKCVPRPSVQLRSVCVVGFHTNEIFYLILSSELHQNFDHTHLSTNCEALSEMAEKMLSKVLWWPSSSASEKCVCLFCF